MILFCRYGGDPADPSAGFVFARHEDGEVPGWDAYPNTIAVSYAGSFEALPTYAKDPTHREAPRLTVEIAAASQSAALDRACAAAILGGFASSALGSRNRYGSSAVDQANVSQDAALAASITDPKWTVDIGCSADGASWSFQPHSAAQVKAVAADMQAARQAARAKLAGLKGRIAAAKTVADVAAVAWA